MIRTDLECPLYTIYIFSHELNLNCPGRWLVPPKPSAAKTWYQTFQEKLPHHFTASYWKNNKPFLLTLYLIIGVNIVLMVQRAYYFKDFAMLDGYTPNVFYMISRACGESPVLYPVLYCFLFFSFSNSTTITVKLSQLLHAILKILKKFGVK